MADQKKLKILFVDDEPNVVLLMKRRLESRGYAVVTAKNGSEAIEIAKKQHPNIIVLDHMMPDLNGLEVCRLLKKAPQTQAIPVIAHTASTEKGLELRFIEAGAVGIIYKPVVVELLNLIKRVLAGETINWEEYIN